MIRLGLELDVTTDEVTASRVAAALDGVKPVPMKPTVPATCRGCGVAQLVPDPGEGTLAWRCWCTAVTEIRRNGKRFEIRLEGGKWGA